MIGTIDRFEGNFAVIELEDRTTINVDKSKLPEGLSEGSVITFERGKIKYNATETQKRKKEIEQLMEDVFE